MRKTASITKHTLALSAATLLLTFPAHAVTTNLLINFDGSIAGNSYTLAAGEVDTTGTFGGNDFPSVNGGEADLGGGSDGFQIDPTSIGALTTTDWVAETMVSFDTFGGGQLTIIDVQGDTDLRISNDGSALEVGYWDGSTWEGRSAALPSAGTPVHLALVWNASASSLTAYVDGTSIGTVDNNTFATPDAGSLSFGYLGRTGHEGRGIDGQLAAVSFATSGSAIQVEDFLLLPEPSTYALTNGDFETQPGSGEGLAVDGWFESSASDYHDWVNIDPNSASQYPAGQGNIFNMSTESGYIYQQLGLRTDNDNGLRVSGDGILRYANGPREFRSFRVSVYETGAAVGGADGTHPSDLAGATLLDYKVFTAGDLGFSATPTGPELQPFSIDLSLGDATTGQMLWLVIDAEDGSDETGLDDLAVLALFSDPGPATPPPAPPVLYSTSHYLELSDSEATKVEKAAKLLPEAKQVDWQRMENTFFIHFGPNTFNGSEWGNGFETPSDFNPTAFDATQWIDVIKQAGGKMVMLVVKHHEGFCLYPSRYTTHDVASSPWLGGAGDVVRAVSDACAAEGIKFGVYLSPADLYQIESPFSYANGSGYYGNGSTVQTSTIPTDSATFGSNPLQGRTPPAGHTNYVYNVDDYNRYFLNQLYELLTEYGEITEVWFDGANPKPGTGQTYNEADWYEMIYALQPNANIAIGGPDVRWVGNETGYARETEWSVIPTPAASLTGSDLGSRALLTGGKTLTWWPAEADTKVLSGWFWKSSHGVKSTTDLISIYHASVGRNANLLLNLSPDTRGLIPDNQITPVLEAFSVIQQTFGTDLAAGGTIAADSTLSGQPASNILDGDLDTYWEADTNNSTATLTLTLPASRTIDRIALQEAIAVRSMRIESFAVDTWNGSSWDQRATGTTVGHKRILQFAATTTDQVRIRILQSRLEPTLANVTLHKAAAVVDTPSIGNRNAAGQVSISDGNGNAIYYTVDGSTPTTASMLYTGPIELPLGGVIRAISHDGSSASFAVSKEITGMTPTGWTVISVDSEELPGNTAEMAIDDDISTHWRTAVTGSGPHPHHITIDMQTARWIGGFSYQPRTVGSENGIVKTYRFEVSEDNASWSNVAESEFGNIKNNPVLQKVFFASPVKARYFRFTSLSEINDADYASAGEINVLPGGYDQFRQDLGMQTALPTDDIDADKNGLLLEYYFGTDPFVADGRPLGFASQGGDFQLDVVRATPIDDITSTVIYTLDLVDPVWFDATVSGVVSTNLGGGLVQDSYTVVSPSESNAFFRVRITR